MNNEPATILEDDNLIEGAEDLNSAVEDILSGVTKAPVYIDDLPDAVVDGVFLLKEGDQLVVEKWVTIAQTPKWLGTTLYRIRRIDPLDDSGAIGLIDEELKQGAMINWKTAAKHGWRLKCAIPNLGLHKRAKPEFTVPVQKPVVLAADGTVVKKKGGRPAGAKNRSPEERAAAQRAEAIKRAEKAARREARKAGRK